jgi:MIP family channel proteins
MAVKLAPVLAEFVALLLFVFICCGCATGVAGEAGWVQQVSLTFGLCITVLAYTIGHYSGGQINGAVTVGLMAAGELEPLQGVCNIFGQLCGSLVGAGLLSAMVKKESDLTGGLGSNGVGSGFSNSQALLGEIVMTFVLMYVVLETAVSKTNNKGDFAPIAIGFAVYLGHVVLIPIDGCSINPTRSFGPAVVATVQDRGSKHFEDFWVFVLGPVIGALLAVAHFKAMTKAAPEVPPEDMAKIELPSRDEEA